MNIVRKFRCSGNSMLNSAGNDGVSPQEDLALGLMHLKKLFSEYLYPPFPLSEQDKDERLYNMLPLFCKVFGNTSCSEIVTKFRDINIFCTHVSRLMVKEIKKRASNQSTEIASKSVAVFLEVENTEESSSGWMLLSTINLLSAIGEPPLIDAMTSVSLPSTLVKCLYLLFDLPELEVDDSQSDSAFTPRERRVLLQKIFVQLLVRLCSHIAPAEELSSKNDLMLLFSAITSWCPAHNIPWRKSAAELLMTISRHGLTATVVSYIHNKECIKLCIDNMRQASDLNASEIIEMFVTIFCFLKDSAAVSQALLDDFKLAGGYPFLQEFLLSVNLQDDAEAQEALKNLVLMISSLCMCGLEEMRPSHIKMNSVFQLLGFKPPQPTGKGISVRNVDAFHVLQSVFLNSDYMPLCSTILDAINAVYHSDNSNYFILENFNTLSEISKIIHKKSLDIQVKFFRLVEFLVFQLNFVPCKELIAVASILKEGNSISCSVACVQTLQAIMKHNPLFKEVYREVGILEVLSTCFIWYSEGFIFENAVTGNEEEGDVEKQLVFVLLEALTYLLTGNVNNASEFRKTDGAKRVHLLVGCDAIRKEALRLIRELIINSGGEEDMATLLGYLHSVSNSSLNAKIQIHKCMLSCLRESHRCRATFRKIGGFVYMMSDLVSMEGFLSPHGSKCCSTEEALNLLYYIFFTITVAMRFEPANAKYFHNEICMPSLCDALRLLGCFSNTLKFENSHRMDGMETTEDDQSLFHHLFTGNIPHSKIPESIPTVLANACLVMRMLYDVAVDNYDKQNKSQLNISFKSPRKRLYEKERSNESCGKLNSLGSLESLRKEPVVVHAGVVSAMFQLLPAVEFAEHQELSELLKLYVANVIKSLMRSERNQQVMCKIGFPEQILSIGKVVLENEIHILHESLQYITERLATQFLEPKDLREFLRLGDPLNCVPVDNENSTNSQTVGGPVPMCRVKTLVSMTTPRDTHSNATLYSSYFSPFVEMDMSAEGFGCLYLPSIAPQFSATSSSTANVAPPFPSDVNANGGIGSGDRIFPPATGLSFSTWVCVERFSEVSSDAHPIRLLTIVRHVQSSKDEHLICLSIVISARDKSIIINTAETSLSHTSPEWEPEGNNDYAVRLSNTEKLLQGQWHHFVFVFNRSVLKNSSFCMYLDGQHFHTQKLHYITQNPGGASANLTVASSVYAYIGTPPLWRKYSRLLWKQGSCHLVEDVFNPAAVNLLYKLGPHYFGCLQAPRVNEHCQGNTLVAEERVIFGLNAKSVSQLTLAKIRKLYSRVDNKSIAKQLGMSSNENATPIYLVHNTAGYMSGPSRTIGGVVIGYLGTRCFYPKPASKVIDNIGGYSILLGLVAMAKDVESLYAALKALVSVTRTNVTIQMEMDRRRGYQTFAMLLRSKKHLLNTHILHLVFNLIGTLDSGRENSSIPHIVAFQDILCDLEIWVEASAGLERTLFEHFMELLTESTERRNNLRIMRDMRLLQRLLYILPSLTNGNSRQILFSLLRVLLANQPTSKDVLSFGQFIVATLPTATSFNEKNVTIVDDFDDLSVEQPHNKSECNTSHDLLPLTGECIKPSDTDESTTEKKLINKIYLRNQCLQLIYSLLYTKYSICPGFAEELVNTLGFDWVMLFAGSNLHKTTVTRSFRILFALCSMPNLLSKFRDGLSNGGWLANTELISHNKLGVLINCQESVPHGYKTSKECRMGMLNIPGFQQLFWLLSSHINLPDVYVYLIGLMLGQYVKDIPQYYKQLDLEYVWKLIFKTKFDISTANRVAYSICPEAITLLFKLVRIIMNGGKQSGNAMPDWLSSYPVSIIQLLFALYQGVSDFIPVLMMPDIINSLAATLFYISNSFPSESSTPAPTPTSAHDQFDYSYVSMTSSDVTDAALTDHPAKKFIIDFLRVIIFDSFLIIQNAKTTPVLDLVLEATPESVGPNQMAKYQTEILSNVMNHMIANDILTVSTNNVPNGNIQNMPNNISYFTCRLVDKLWQGLLLRDSLEIYEFIMKLISMTKRKNVTFSLEDLYRSLNRTILYLLSRETDNVASQIPVLDTLHKIASHRNVVFGANNHDLEFIGCLIYCLLQLTRDLKILLDTNVKTTWHVNPQYSAESEELTTTQGQNLMAVAAKRVWRELYLSKKSAIEEVFKITLPASVDGKVPDLIIVRELIFELSSKLWLNYVDTEKKGTSKVTWEFHNHLQSKIQKVTGGLTRLASRSKVKREETVKVRWPKVSRHDFLSWTVSHISSVIELTEFESRRYSLNQQHMLKYVTGEWLLMETELTRERGLWGPEFPNSLDKWMLDATEGPSRMRKRMMRNDDFYLHYPYRPYLDNEEHKSLKYKVAISLDSKQYFQIYRPQGLFKVDKEPPFIMLKENSLSYEEISQITPDIINNAFHGLKKASTNRSASELDDTIEDSESECVSEDVTPPTDNQALIRLLDQQEKISHMFRTARIQGLDKIEGLLLFGKENMYVVDGFTILKSREIRDIESLSAENYEPILPSPSGSNTSSTSNGRKQCSKLSYEDVREVHKRRYLLQPIALEIFFADGRNYLLAFPRKVRNKVYQRMLTHATAIADSAHLSVAGQKRTASVEQVPGILSNLIGDPSVTQRWVRGEISNFQYLMHLNTLAGRSYNDLMQYPVFPWILADYTSEHLDLTNPSTFRDFSKPMGAQTPTRLKEFEKRFKDWDDPHGETPPYHYGTHYSSAMIVCSYLVRMEPFTQHFLRLQGGHFDLADRMFNSIAEAWLSASKHNMADVKELIPEFFYLPEFLLNSNNFDLGCKQNGVQLNDVILPNWAKEDPREFIRIHREALECDYVSQHLHEWIDLIFGYKQAGEHAVKSVNVFHHLFYEGNVDIYSIDDPLKKNATIGFINNFGQIPKQLFKKPHPSKKLSSRLSMLDYSALMMNVMCNNDDKLFFHHLDNLKPSLQPLKELKGAVGQIIQSERGSVLAVEQNKVLIPPAYNKTISWSSADHSLRISHYDTERVISVCELAAQSFGEIVACVCPNPKLMITGSSNSVVTMWSVSSSFRELSVIQYLYGHTDAITCLAVSASYSIVISGSRDCTAIIWDLSKRIFIRQLRDHRTAIGCIAINETTGDIAVCSGTWLHMYSVNGEILAVVNTAVGRVDRMQQILCVAFSLCREWDVESVVMTGSADGVVRMWSIDYVQVPKKSRDMSKRNEVYSDEKEELTDDNTKCSMSSPKKRVYNSLIMQMNISTEVINKGMLMKSTSESSLSEHESHQKIREKVCKQILAMDKVNCNSEVVNKNEDKADISTESNIESKNPTIELDSDLVIEETLFKDIECDIEKSTVVRRGRSNGKTNPRNRKSECITADKSVRSEETELRPSKSDTNLSQSYIILNTPTTYSTSTNERASRFYDKLTNQPSSPCGALKEGFKWQRQLIFRSKLTMHTAYDRRDNTEPASVTTIAVSKDHRAVFVGDARGRIFNWCVVDQPGRGAADHWLKDEGADICTGCGIRFSVYERKHHCRNCGLVFCSKCSRFESEINRLRIFKPVRVCQRCYTELRPAGKT